MTSVKREWLLLSGVVIVTLAVCLLLLRWLAPQLIGLPVDLRLVQVSETLPPFYEGIFRNEDYQSREFILNDPVVVSRARPRIHEGLGTGPHDILGFRNHSVPNVADVVVIGDSQTYGNNVQLDDNWPSRLSMGLRAKSAIVYTMATGGWGAAQYVNMATKVPVFLPQLVIVAFYSGNDALESFRLAYSLERFEDLRPDPSLGPNDAPAVEFPAPPEEQWPVTFDDGISTVFTPALRLTSNDDHPAVRAGYGVMANAAREIRRLTRPFGIEVIFTIIPTKEIVYADKIRRENIATTEAYERLIAWEAKNIAALAEALGDIPDAVYVDVTAPLSEAALAGAPLYPTNENGHPLHAGYAVIGDVLAEAVGDRVRARPKGLMAVPVSRDGALLYLSDGVGVWRVASLETAVQNGWREDQIQTTSFRALAGLTRLGVLDQVDPARFGPGALK